MKITTWNVNGIRSLKSIASVLDELSTDIACFQETKASRSQIPETTALIDGFTSYFSYPRKQSGYSGVATYCREKFSPDDAEEGLTASPEFRHEVQEANALACWELSSNDLAGFDPEGRVVTTYHFIKNNGDVQRLAIINVYCPRVDPEKLERHVYKMQFCLLLEAKMRELCQKGCSVIIVGDLNISHSIIDHCDPGPEREFNSSEARQWLKSFLSCKIKFLEAEVEVIDAFRHFYPDKKAAYTCWNTKTGARQTNYGTRIDYILLSSNLLPILDICEIMSDYQGSDHCPVRAVLNCDSISEKSVQLPSLCTRLWPEFSGQQQKLKAFFQRTQNNADRVTNQKELGAQTERKIGVKKNKQKSITNFFKAPSVSVSKNSCLSGADSAENGDVMFQNGDVMGQNGGSRTDGDSSKVSNDSSAEQKNGEVCSGVGESYSKNNSSSVWKSMLSGPPKPPLCSGHQKECVLRTVKKKGPNCGRNFFMCPQPAGHSSNPDASCNFFKWVNAPKVNTLK